MSFDLKCIRGSSFALGMAFLTMTPVLAGQEETPGGFAEAVPRTLVALELAQNGDGKLSPARRSAVESALVTIARAADVVVCHEGLSSIATEVLDPLCSAPESNLPRLWWRARIETLKGENPPLLQVLVELEAGGEAPAGPAQMVLLSRTLLPPVEEAQLDSAVAEWIVSELPGFGDLERWFGALNQRADLQREWPAEEASRPTAESYSAELEAISDLLIDGKNAEANRRATRLLEEEDLPVDVATRARELRAKAETRSQTPKPAELQRKIEIQGPEPAAGGASFEVREALVGGGFDPGVSGRLRITSAGLSFTPHGKSAPWTVKWPNLTEARQDTGIWDAPDPVVLIERGGGKRYIVRIDEKGRYLSSAPLLAAIARGRTQPAAPAKSKDGR